MKLPRMALAMIAKNDAPVIGRALRSVRPLVSAWIVVDTGSTDDTPAMAKACMAGLPGRVVERPWVNFAANRNEALDLAYELAEYAIVLDADDEFVIEPERLACSQEGAPSYWIDCRIRGRPGVVFRKIHVVHRDSGYRYMGATHEALVPAGNDPMALITGLIYETHVDGAHRPSGAKLRRDIALLSEAVKQNPADLRSLFYLAQTYRDMGRLAEALVHYEARGRRGGWLEEAWRARLEAALILEQLGIADDSVLMAAFLFAYELDPRRAEPLHALACALRDRKRYALALLFAERAAALVEPTDLVLSSDRSVYAWRARDEMAVALTWLGRDREAVALWEPILSRSDLSEKDRARIEENVRDARTRNRG